MGSLPVKATTDSVALQANSEIKQLSITKGKSPPIKATGFFIVARTHRNQEHNEFNWSGMDSIPSKAAVPVCAAKITNKNCAVSVKELLLRIT